MDKAQFSQLVQRYQAGQATDAEKAFLEAYYAAFEARPDVIGELTAAEQNKLEGLLYEELKEQLPVRHIRHQRWWGYAAASLLLLLAAGSYFWFRDISPHPAAPIAAEKPAEVLPGKTGAVLTLANGTQVVLDSLANGMVATQNGARVMLNNGLLTYAATGNNTGEAAYNTMTTPKGRQFHVQLPDGTGVWLNAGSSVRYPTFFTGENRLVAVTGEVYFEVAANSKMPFKVTVNNRAEIDVLGTHFNVNAYEDEISMNTTLLQGAIRFTALSAADKPVVLRPGQQAQFSGNIPVVKKANQEQVMAWKNGYFNFEGKSLEEVLRQLSRWYDITVVTEGRLPDIRFGGEMEMGLPLSDVLNFLEKSDVHFRIAPGRKLIVYP